MKKNMLTIALLIAFGILASAQKKSSMHIIAVHRIQLLFQDLWY